MNLLKDSQQLLKDIEGLDSARHLDVIVGRAAEFGRSCVEHGERVNSLVAMFPGGVGFLQTGFTNAKEKEEVFGQAANYLAQRGASLAVLVVDTWAASPGWEGRPSDDPNRTEAVLVQAVAPNGNVVYAWKCSYNRKGSRIEWCDAQEGHIHDGELQGLLRPWITTVAGQKCWLGISTKADGESMRIFPPSTRPRKLA